VCADAPSAPEERAERRPEFTLATGGPPPQAELSPLVRYALSHLEDNFLHPANLRDIAGGLNKSQFQLIRSFRRELHTTPHAYLIGLRIARAIQLLQRGETIAQAAAAAGFSDQSHLTRHFKRWTGTTPGAYRRMDASASLAS
jgi:AraC-like DNA-binding protein